MILEAKPKTQVIEDVHSKMKKFGSEMCPIGPEIKLAIEALKSEDQAKSILQLIGSGKFLALHEKNRFGILFYIILEIAYRQTGEAFLSGLVINKGGTAGKIIFSLFDDISSLPNSNIKIENLDQYTIQIWDNFVNRNPRLKEALEACLDAHYELAKTWSTIGTIDYVDLPFRMVERRVIDKRAFLLREILAGSNTLFLMCSKTISTLNEKGSDKKIMDHYNIGESDLSQKKIEIANRTVRYFFRTLATQMPNPWQHKIAVKNIFDLYLDETGNLVVSSKEFQKIGSESLFDKGIQILTGQSGVYVLREEHTKVISGCPAAFHPVFAKIPDVLFKKAFS
jgi:hypothetical protein